jgi:hypothetical protein
MTQSLKENCSSRKSSTAQLMEAGRFLGLAGIIAFLQGLIQVSFVSFQ